MWLKNAVLGILVCLPVVQGGAELKCGISAMCLIGMEKVDSASFKSLMRVKSYADVKIMTNEEYESYVDEVRTACAPYNKVVECYAGKASNDIVRRNNNAYWKCHDKETLYNTVLKSAKDDKQAMIDAGITSPAELEKGFQAMNDICSSTFVDGMETHGKCLRQAVKTNDTLSERTDSFESALNNPCFAMNCIAARLYTNFYVWTANSVCGSDAASWVFRFAKQSLSYNQKGLANCPELTSDNWEDYKEPIQGNPVKALNYVESANCVTVPPTTKMVTAKPTTKKLNNNNVSNNNNNNGGGSQNCPPGYRSANRGGGGYSNTVGGGYSDTGNSGTVYDYYNARKKRNTDYYDDYSDNTNQIQATNNDYNNNNNNNNNNNGANAYKVPAGCVRNQARRAGVATAIVITVVCLYLM